MLKPNKLSWDLPGGVVRLTVPEKLQMMQLSRHAPDLFAKIEKNLRNFPALDHRKSITKKMRELFGRLTAQQTGLDLVNVNGRTGTLPEAVIIADLVIASKKYGRGSTTNAAAPIAWVKLAGKPKQKPREKGVSLVTPTVMDFLLGYELLTTEVQDNQIIQRYRKIKPPAIFPGDGSLNDDAFDGPLPKETRRLIEQAQKAREAK